MAENLNRNFPTDWGRSYGQTYSGPRPASEPETRALMAFLDEVNPQYLVSFHQPLRGVGVADNKLRPASRGEALARRFEAAPAVVQLHWGLSPGR
ncbi:MAG: M14 family zinc carboxypeptidase [Nocardioidaceae bacterium]